MSKVQNRKPGLPVPGMSLTRGQLDIALMRTIIVFLGTWQQCNRACRRMRACASPTCACFDLNRDNIHAMLTEIVEWPRFEGPREDWDAARAPVEVFD